ncbi:glycoside hydrolase family 44 protein [Paenibacillus sedimenti]|uniref:Ig-like domain-containing protein n=1 Tax=Paenibacillus sedimenti TaxID=2770274 RepID=A0A926QK77_9BACL|nr:glycoside hydrolase family 44 protein [Paenibacillus sedimenti]MBD0382526.1 Ig-like domain-containing protein [Paenibacillus sedimenti]
MKHQSYRARRRLRHIVASGLAYALLFSGILPGAQPVQVAEAAAASTKLVVYDDGLRNSFADYSWAAHKLTQTSVIHAGTTAIQMMPDGDGALYLYKDRIISLKDYPLLEFWVHGGTAGGQNLDLGIQSGGQRVATVALNTLLPEGKLTAGKWQKVQVDLTTLAIPNQIYDGIMLQGTTTGSQPVLYIDDISLVQDIRLDSINLTPNTVSLKKGDQQSVTATAAYTDGSSVAVSDSAVWQSEHPETATVERGQLTAVQAGTTVVTATYGGKSASMTVTVTEPAPSPGPTPTPPPAQDGPGLSVYNDQLHESFQDYSWAQHDLNDTANVHTGTKAISFDPSNDGGLYLYKGDGPVTVKDYEKLEFWVHGGAEGGQQVDLKFNAGGETVAKVDIGGLLDGGRIPAGQWAKASITLADIGLKENLFDALLFHGAVSSAQPSLYIDDIRLLPKYVAPPQLVETVLSQYQLVLKPGDTSKLQLTANYNNGTSKDASAAAAWTSSDPSVLAVQGGTLSALKQGVAKVTASLDGVSSSAYVAVTDVTPIPMYTDALTDGYSDWSWGTRDFANATQAYAGTRSVSFAARGYEGIWVHKNEEPFETAQTYGLRFHVYGGGSGGQKLKVLLMDGRNFAADYEMDNVLPQGGLPAGQWVEATVKLADLGMTTPSFDGIVIQAWGEHDQGTVYFDNIEILKNANVINLPNPDLPKVSVTIDQQADRRAVSPDIFGVNFEDTPTENGSQLKFPFKRWGGNQMTRYNWELDTTNRGGDWYFLNVPYETNASGKTLSDQFIEQSIADKTKVLLQVPTIGWTPKSRDISWSFSIQKYGQQAGNECDYHEAWCRKDAGNGLKPDRTHVTGNDPTDTSKQVGPEFIGRWIDKLKQKYGNNVRNYALDNEPALWGYSHWDVHPQMTNYDEIWNYTVNYGSMIKAKDPGANVYGPVAWGWCEYFYSAKDGCYSGGEDMKSHGDKPFLEWYLSQVSEYQKQKNVRLVDYLDIHYYPAEADVAFSSDESPAMTKRRFNSLKSLYDPAFQDASSWIQEPVNLIPRMRDIIQRNAPDTKLAITEYNFGDGTGIGSGLAQAEALAIFAREGVDVATRWGALLANTPLEDAFKLYINYDGQGSKVEGDAVKTVSSNIDAVGAYTIVSPQGKKFVLLFNKDTAPRTAEVKADTSLDGTASIYRFDAKQRLQASGNAQVDDGMLSIQLPARSASLVVIP